MCSNAGRSLFAAGSVVLLLLAGRGALAAGSEGPASALLPVLRGQCLKCHGQDGEVNGEVDFSAIATTADLLSRPELLAEMVRVVRDGEMPPTDEPPLPAAVKRNVVEELDALLGQSLKSTAAIPRTPLRRMNRFQYANAVTDLFDLKVEVFELPECVVRDRSNYFQPAKGKLPDEIVVGNRPLGKSQTIAPRLHGVAAFPQDLRAEHGFDNRGDLLTLSPLLMESFVSLAGSIVHSSDFTEKNVGIWKEFFAPPRETGDVETEMARRLRSFLARAFRRPVEEEVLSKYTGLALATYRDGGSFTAGMLEAAAAALVSPRFLYLFDGRSTASEPEPVDDFELASRLSFFLWGSIPDQELLDVAAAGDLHEPETLTAQVDRMLDDRKLKRFCDSFPTQWLQLERIVASVPDREKFPEFYFAVYRASMHMMLEPLLLFEAVLIEDRPVTTLIDADFTYRSELLDSLYRTGRLPEGPPQVTSLRFRRLPVADRREGGVITNAAVMTMNSTPVRSQPITRGAWVVGVIFNDPPAPPPADVPPLEEDQPGSTQGLTLREKLTQHRQRADCKGCHEKIDPYGFALENYDPIGLWRETYEGGQPIDASGRMPNGREFGNIVEFKDALLAEPDRFTRAFAAHLLSFALSRELKAADQPELDRIVRAVAKEEYRMRPLIREIVLSRGFLMKYNPGE